MNWHELPRVCAVRTIQQVAIFGSTSGVSTGTVTTDPLQLLPELINDALCNAYWLDTDALQGCDLPIIKEATYGFNQNVDVVATLPSLPLDSQAQQQSQHLQY